jgi:hypothetical protein
VPLRLFLLVRSSLSFSLCSYGVLEREDKSLLAFSFVPDRSSRILAEGIVDAEVVVVVGGEKRRMFPCVCLVRADFGRCGEGVTLQCSLAAAQPQEYS